MGDGEDGAGMPPSRHSLRKQEIQKDNQPSITTVANASGSERKSWVRARTAFHGSLILNDGSK